MFYFFYFIYESALFFIFKDIQDFFQLLWTILFPKLYLFI